jgi:DNA-binding CsgD family transcriptional regulator/sugar-specific transcriptional regulator TrmB
MLELLGLTDHDERVYRYEVRNPGRDLVEVARATGVPPEDVTRSREHLAQIGLIRVSTTGETAPTVRGPSMVADRLRGELDVEYAHKRDQLATAQTELARLVNEETVAATSGERAVAGVHRLQDPDIAMVKLLELMQNVRREFIQIEPDSRTEPLTGPDAALEAELRAIGRGVTSRVIYPPAALSQPAVRRRVQRKMDAGAAVRTFAGPPTRVLIFDRAMAVMVDGTVATPECLLIQETLLVRALTALFETWWQQSRDAGRYLTAAEDVGPDERIMLDLLSTGLKDETIANRLGISVRTVRRKIAEIQQKLSANSRFQVGVLAARRGWV